MLNYQYIILQDFPELLSVTPKEITSLISKLETIMTLGPDALQNYSMMGLSPATLFALIDKNGRFCLIIVLHSPT